MKIFAVTTISLLCLESSRYCSRWFWGGSGVVVWGCPDRSGIVPGSFGGRSGLILGSGVILGSSWSVLESFWSILGVILEHSGVVLERSGVILERSGASWGHSGPSWVVLNHSEGHSFTPFPNKQPNKQSKKQTNTQTSDKPHKQARLRRS